MNEFRHHIQLAKLFSNTSACSTLEMAKPLTKPARSNSMIPRVIHQIWLGSPLPNQLRDLRQSWTRLHPWWKFKLWTDSDLSEMKCRELIESTDCYGQKSDVMRAEILYRHGGFYIDLDYQCLRPIDSLVEEGATFVAATRWILQAHLAWPRVWSEPLIICNSMMGSIAGHPILSDYLERVRNRWDDRPWLDLYNGELDRISLLALGGGAKAAHIKETGLRTYLPFDEAVRRHVEGSNPCDLRVLSPESFHPHLHGWPQIYTMPHFWQKWRTSGEKSPRLWKISKNSDASFAKHLSNSSWL